MSTQTYYKKSRDEEKARLLRKAEREKKEENALELDIKFGKCRYRDHGNCSKKLVIEDWCFREKPLENVNGESAIAALKKLGVKFANLFVGKFSVCDRHTMVFVAEILKKIYEIISGLNMSYFLYYVTHPFALIPDIKSAGAWLSVIFAVSKNYVLGNTLFEGFIEKDIKLAFAYLYDYILIGDGSDTFVRVIIEYAGQLMNPSFNNLTISNNTMITARGRSRKKRRSNKKGTKRLKTNKKRKRSKSRK